jgi:hypothetical protein
MLNLSLSKGTAEVRVEAGRRDVVKAVAELWVVEVGLRRGLDAQVVEEAEDIEAVVVARVLVSWCLGKLVKEHRLMLA